MEINPNDFEMDEQKFEILQQHEVTRLEIFADLLNTCFGLETEKDQLDSPTMSSKTTIFKNAFFLGRYEVCCRLQSFYINI